MSSETVKPIAGQHRQAQDVDPAQILVQVGPGKAGHQEGGAEDADGFAGHESDDDARPRRCR